MQLVLNTYGTYLHKKGDCFEVKKGEEKFLVSVRKVDQIMIATSAYLSTDAIKLATLERKYDGQFRVVFEAIRQLMAPPEPTRRKIGFHVKEGKGFYKAPGKKQGGVKKRKTKA